MPKAQGKARFPDPAVIDALIYLKGLYESIHTRERRGTPEGGWINEAFVIRLWAVLEAHNVVGRSLNSIDPSIDGADKVRVCCQVRNAIVHSNGRLDEVSEDKRQWLHDVNRELRTVFNLTAEPLMFQGRFMLPKDKVLRPMWEGCKLYSENLVEQERRS